jgi:hypothetical protein
MRCRVEVGDPRVWLEHSDHMPLIVTVGERRS